MKKIFITGAGSGLGKEAAITLARRGHTVYASVHYKAEIQEIQNIIDTEKLDMKVFKLDVLNEDDRHIIFNYNFDTFISNAAIGDSGSVLDVPVNRIRKVFETNIFSNLEIIQLASANYIQRNQNGRIIIISSLAGEIPMPFLSPYCASKAALISFAKCLKDETKLLKKLNKDISIEISLILPGAYATGFNKENNEKKYEWMTFASYFSNYVDKIQENEEKVWNFIEQKPYTSIIKCYIKSVEDEKAKFIYSAPWWQNLGIRVGIILGK